MKEKSHNRQNKIWEAEKPWRSEEVKKWSQGRVAKELRSEEVKYPRSRLSKESSSQGVMKRRSWASTVEKPSSRSAASDCTKQSHR